METPLEKISSLTINSNRLITRTSTQISKIVKTGLKKKKKKQNRIEITYQIAEEEQRGKGK